MPTIRSVASAWRKRKVKHLAEGLDKANHLLAAKVASNAPVDSGELRGSVHATSVKVEAARISAAVVVSSDHALPTEYGTDDQGPQPFFRPAIRSEAPAMISLVKAGAR
jgi:HK97 gp10 family phage protein